MIKYIIASICFLGIQIMFFYRPQTLLLPTQPSLRHHPPNVHGPNRIQYNPHIPALPPHHAYFNNCSSFDFDPVTWTAYRKNSVSSESEECRTMYDSLIKEKSIKWIIHVNGTLENLGCSKHTKMCTESSRWDFNRDIRINTPPCCLEAMKDVFRIVTTDLQKHGIPHIVFGGAMLGYARNKQFVPYDNDLDVWMDGKYWDTPLFDTIQKKWKEVDQIHTEYKDGGGKLWVLWSEENGNGLDIWPWYVKGPKVHIAKNYDIPKYDVPKELIFPLKFTNFGGIPTYVPGDPENYCKWQYGRNWRTERKCTRVERRKCME